MKFNSNSFSINMRKIPHHPQFPIEFIGFKDLVQNQNKIKIKLENDDEKSTQKNIFLV